MNGNLTVIKIIKEYPVGGSKVKEIWKSTTLLLTFFMIFALLGQGSLQFIYSNSQFHVYNENLTPLHQNISSPVDTPQTGIIPPLRNLSPRERINNITNEQDQYFPGSSITITNRFNLTNPDHVDYCVIEQDVYIFLFEETSWTPQEMITESNKTDGTGKYISNDTAQCIYYVHTTTTNGTKSGTGASLSADPAEGWINTTFTIPDISTLNTMGIQSDDNVTIFQFYPSLNVSESRIGTDFFIYHTDRFQVSSVATFTSEGFINDESGDETFRQGGNATAILTAASGASGIDNVTITIDGLYNKSNDVEITNPSSLGIDYPRLGFTTNASGEIELSVNTSYSTPESEYYFIVSANFTRTSFYTENYGKITNTTANFTVLNEWDYVEFVELQAEPSSLAPPESNTTIVTVRARAQYAYDTQPYYYLSGLPVNATLDSYPAGVTLTVLPGYTPSGTPGYYLTNDTGLIAFNITAEYPILYKDIVSNINFTANLTNTTLPIYPYTSGSVRSPHRFLRGTGDTLYVSDDVDISINPDFWVGNIHYSWSNVTNIRPGESADVRFEVNSAQTSDTFVNVPVKIELITPIPGVTLKFNASNPSAWGNYHYTDGNGYIYVKISTTYLTTPEIDQTINLNITVDFENDSNLRWIGPSNAITDWGWGDTLTNFKKTWLNTQSTDITINPSFTYCTIDLSTTNETGDTIIRPGDAITVTFKVQGGGSDLSNVPVNISFVGNYAGVSMSIFNAGGSPRPNYYYTTISGDITILLTTTYGTTPKNLDIKLNATADFQNDTNPDVWYIGQKPTGVLFRSNRSWSDVERSITVAPQYFIGDIYRPTDNPPNPNTTLVQHNEALEVEFRLRLREYPTGPWISPPTVLIDGVNISILINGQTPDQFKMGVTSAWKYSDDGSVTFTILMNATGFTPEGTYTLEANADFGAAKSLIYNFTHATVPSGHLSGVWVNGSTTDVSSKTSFVFEVKNIDIIRVWIPTGGVTDPFHSDAGFNSTTGLFEVYRSTTNITINGTYKDNTQQAVIGDHLEIRMDHSNAQRVRLASDVVTYNWGFSVIIQLPNNTPIQDNIEIYGEDPTPPTPPERRENYSDIRVVTTIDLSDMAINIANGSTVFVGENVSITGTLIDNLNLPIDSEPANSPFSPTFSELTDNLRVVGWNGTHEIGIPQIASPNPSGTYYMTYQIPNDYNQDTLSIRLNITHTGLLHYRVNYTQAQINIYWDFQITNLEIYFPYNETSTGLANGTTYLVSGENNRDITIRGTLSDSSGRELGGKWINTTWNDTISPSPANVTPTGYFTLDYSFTGLKNGTWIWEFHHLLDNGTELSDIYIITLKWEVFDITAPIITILVPTENQTSPGFALLLPNPATYISVYAIDPSLDYVSDGLDNSSVVIQINGINHSMNQIAGQYLFEYDWTPTNLSDINYNIIIFASDVAHNWNTTGITVVFDVVAPTGTIDVSEQNAYLEVVNGVVTISGTIEDDNSDTGLNFGINDTSIRLYISNPTPEIIRSENISSIAFTNNSYSYDWVIILDPDDLENIHRDGNFTGFEEWTINITFFDLAGNEGYIILDVKLDSGDPTLDIISDLPLEVDKELTINVSYEDGESGIYEETLAFELLNATEDVVAIFRHGDADITAINSEATFVLDTSDLDDGEYSIRILIRDKTGNLDDITTGSFIVSHPSPPNPFTNIIVLLVSPVLAFGGGIGLAALYERFKGLRGA